MFAPHCPATNCLLSISPQLLRNPSLLYCIAGELHNCDEVRTAQARFQSSSLFATTERGVGEIPGNDVAYISESSVMFVGTITVKRRLEIFRIPSSQLQQGPKICQTGTQG